MLPQASGATLATIDRLARTVRDVERRTQLGYADPSGQVWVQADGLWYRRAGLEASCRGIVAVDGGATRRAHPWERDRLLSRLPRHRGIVVGADALTRLAGSGVVVTLECALPLERFEEVVARRLAGAYLLDRAVPSTPPGLPRALRQALDDGRAGNVPGATAWHRQALEIARAARPEATRGQRLGRRIERAVRMGGAALRRWFEVSETQSVVMWEARGRHVTTHVRSADLAVVSAGICVSGQDRIFDLVALCSAVTRQTRSR